jgi:hypothetical protein
VLDLVCNARGFQQLPRSIQFAQEPQQQID